MFEKQETLTIEQSQDFNFTHFCKVSKIAITSVFSQIKHNKINFFVTHLDSIAVIPKTDLEFMDIEYNEDKTYFYVKEIFINKSYPLFCLETDVFNLVTKNK